MKKSEVSRHLKALLAALVTTCAYGANDNAQHVQIMPDEIKWTEVPAAPGLKISWLIGSQDKPGLYELRVHLMKGAVIPPHTHPDRRCVTVLSGDFYGAEGSIVETNKTKRFPPGSFHCVDAGVPHYVVAKDGDIDFQDSGIAPTGTAWLKK